MNSFYVKRLPTLMILVTCLLARGACGADSADGQTNKIQRSPSPAAATTTQPSAGDIPTKIGVYDVDKVAQSLGWAEDMRVSMEDAKKKYQSELSYSQGLYNEQIADQKKQWAPKATDKLSGEQQQVLVQMRAYANEVLKQLNENATKLMVEYRQQCVVQYHRALRPVLKQVAEEQKLAVVFEQNDAIQYVAPSSDITNLVIEAARAHPPLIEPVKAPRLPDPGPMKINFTESQPTTKPIPANLAPSE